MKHKHSLLRRALSIVLSFAIMLPASLALIGDSGSAHAASKNRIKVLAIEPSDSERLTRQNVRDWTDKDYATGKIDITYMSSLEFIGRTEDLSENYDLIYIGNNSNVGSYIDNAVNKLDSGLKYANIGSQIAIPSPATGLTDSEYSNTKFFGNYNALKDAQNTRYSGNDLTPKKLEELNAYVAADHPVIISDGLTINGGHSATSAVTFISNIASTANSSYVKLTASAVSTGGTLPIFSPTYQWYEGDNAITSGGTSPEFSAYANGTYYCKITYTIDGKAYTATSKSVNVTVSQPSISNSTLADGSAYLYYYYGSYLGWQLNSTNVHSVSVELSDINDTLTASTHYVSGQGSNTAYSYQWYNESERIYGATGRSYTPTVDGSYYCTASPTQALCYYVSTYTLDGFPARLANVTPATSQTVILKRATITDDSTQPGSPATIPAIPATNFTIDSDRVDNCSYMYTFLNGVKGKENVMRTTNIISETLLNKINLPKPIINLTEMPPEYTSATGATLQATAGIYTLSYTFTITDTITNSTSSAATPIYYCKLHIDSNANGIYGSEELVPDIVIRKVSGGSAVPSNGSVIPSGELKTDGTVYSVTYPLPAGNVGIIPWKLEVARADIGGVHASVSNYTRLAPSTPKTINILQINTGRNASQQYGKANTTTSPYGGLSLDTSDPYISDYGVRGVRNTIHDRFDEIASDYIINIQTVTTTQMRDIGITGIPNTLTGADATNNITTFLNSYDMIIMGIDNYYNELSSETAKALALYLRSGPILFTHNPAYLPAVPTMYMDNPYSSNCNIPADFYYGYNYNTVLRNPLGLDRYGVVDDTYGHTIMSNPGLTRNELPVTTSGIVASNEYARMSEAQKNDLLAARYSIAYLPKSNTNGTGGIPVVTTHGFGNYLYDTDINSTTSLSQVNEGQITTYPFDINTSAYGGSIGNTVNVKNTHSPYYQLNMNSDDVVVWYCLSGSSYENNDVASAYYIYNSGNATYSGFGNTIQSITTNEAKLFVNTIIAAYSVAHSAITAPKVKFCDITGSKVLANFLLPTDNDGVLTTTGSTSTDRNLYFVVTDTYSGIKKTTAALSYGPSGAQNPINNVKIYYMSGTTETLVQASDSLVSGRLYYVKIDNVWGQLPPATQIAFVADTTGAGLPINVTATTTVGGSTPKGATTTLTFRKLTLFNLS